MATRVGRAPRRRAAPKAVHAPRLVLEVRDDGSRHLVAKDLAEVEAALGIDVLVAFCACAIHADRLVSLYSFSKQILAPARHGLVAKKRDFMTVYSFVVGTLKELGLGLQQLRTALIKRGLWDQSRWQSSLQHWETWAEDHLNSVVRNQLAFHVDISAIQRGVELTRDGGAPTDIYAGDEPTFKYVDSWFALAHTAFLHALGEKQRELGTPSGGVPNLSDFIPSPAEMMHVGAALDEEFVEILRCLGAKPLLCRIRGTRIQST